MRYFIFIILICLVSCKTIIKEVPVTEVRTEYNTKYLYDSIYLKDSTMVYIKGDTVYKYKERTNTKYIILTDTFIKNDTIPKIIKVYETKEVEKNLHWWQKLLMGLGVLFAGMTLVKIKRFIK